MLVVLSQVLGSLSLRLLAILLSKLRLEGSGELEVFLSELTGIFDGDYVYFLEALFRDFLQLLELKCTSALFELPIHGLFKRLLRL